MAWDGEFTIDTGDGAGEFIVNDDGTFGVGEDCCCGTPCTECATYSAITNAEITISGSCSGSWCNSIATQEWYRILKSFTNYSTSCAWQKHWEDKSPPYPVGADWYLIILYYPTTNIWKAGILVSQSGTDTIWGRFGYNCDGSLTEVSGISCVGGVLEGTFDLDGLAACPYDDENCYGCTATVDLNPGP